ncbi:MAG: VCBS repeat-containing protein, partial [Planctomycetota bacterium]
MLLPLLVTLVSATWTAPAQEPESADSVLVFETTQLSTDFYCEGAAFGDFDGDGDGDVAAGPFWYEGPGFRVRHRIYESEVFDVAGYSDNFFAWARDFDGDGLLDLFVIGFPGREAWWFQNPGEGDELWPRHLVHDNVDNESPWLTDLDGDGLEDLVCSSGGSLCWFERDASDPTARWIRHDLSADIGLGRFTHGMGVGDLNGDGRADVLLNTGWWEQPESLAGDPHWQHHPYLFSTGQGGAQMLVQDVDGDGDNDVISSLNAHKYGLSWFEQIPGENGAIDFVAHPIMGRRPGQHGCPLAVSELHALDTADINGDGLLDVITGKRWHSHGSREKGADDPAYLLWFELRRGESGVTYTPHVIHDDSGVGTQVMVGDIDGDGRVDV